jgi:hypothetical protein
VNSPNGAADNSQGRQPLVKVAKKADSPNGATLVLLAAKCRPVGAETNIHISSRRSRPWLLTYVSFSLLIPPPNTSKYHFKNPATLYSFTGESGPGV